MGPFTESWLAASLVFTCPILLAATGELVSERAGVVNIGLEGMMLSGAFFAFLVAWLAHSFVLGVIAGGAAGALLAAIMALLTVSHKLNQIVVGVGLNILALGLTSFLFEQIFTLPGRNVLLPLPRPWRIPLLSGIPVIGRAFFDQTPLAYLAFLLVPAVAFVLSRTTWGLAVRSSGERPAAADSAGIRVDAVRWAAVAVAGLLAGVGGAFLSIGQVGIFVEDMSDGLGYIALAAVIFGGWRPLGVLLASLLFGATDELQLELQSSPAIPRQVWVALALAALALFAAHVRATRPLRIRPGQTIAVACFVAGAVTLAITAPRFTLPPQLWLAVPYVVAIAALAGLVRRGQTPLELGVPYRRSEVL
jgi:general nucleoside transport system permease protein